MAGRAAPIGFPAWIKPGLNITNGRDQLALETITINQIMPILVPGVVALSRRARYLSFYLFLLDEFHRRGGGTQDELATFIKRAEYEYLLAVRHCTRAGCGDNATAIIGYFEVQRALDEGAPFRRGESIEGALGGYGQQYRSLLQALELVAPKGWLVDGKPLSLDRATKKGEQIARAFRTRLAKTSWYLSYLGAQKSIPAKVMEELSDQACLCRLEESVAERDLLQAHLFGSGDQRTEDQRERLASFAVTLDIIAKEPKAADSESRWRRRIWDVGLTTLKRNDPRSRAVAGWAALVAKEVYQDALAVMWSAICEWGAATQPTDGFLPGDLRQRLVKELFANGKVFGVKFSAKEPATALAHRLSRELGQDHLEDLRDKARESPVAAMNGFALLLILWARLPDSNFMPAAWRLIGRQHSTFQLGLLTAFDWFKALPSDTSASEVFETVALRWVVQAHDRVGCDRLPNFIFRFRFVEGRWQFMRTLSTNPFSLGDSRHDAMVYMSRDLGLWRGDGKNSVLTDRGRSVIREAFD